MMMYIDVMNMNAQDVVVLSLLVLQVLPTHSSG
jgi:hypothetical protein